MKHLVIAATLLATTVTTAQAQMPQINTPNHRLVDDIVKAENAKRAEREKQRAEAAERERQAREKRQAEAAERERQAQIDAAERERQAREKQAQAQAEAAERERQLRAEAAERERQAREKQQAEAAERERQAREYEAQRPAREAAERQATIEAARQDALRKEAAQKAMDEKAERARKEAEEAKRAEPAPAKPPAATVGDFKADYIIARGAIGCANLDEGALSTGKATGRIFDPSDPDHCRDISVGTAVLSQKRFRNAVCVVPEGDSPPCVWVLSDELKPAQAKPSVAAGDSKLRDADLRAAAEAFRLRPQDFAVGSTAGGLSVFLSRCRSTHPELSPAAVAAIKDASAQINRRYDTHDMTRLTSDILLGEFREIGADQWCQAFKKVIEEAVR